MRIVSRTGICKTPSGTHYLDVGGSVNFDTTLNIKGNLLLDSTATIEAASGAGGDVTLGASTDTTIINIGAAAHAKTINIGGPADTVIIDGNVLTNNTTNLTVEDKLITLNKGGLASSAGTAGIDFEEASSITGYIRTSSDRSGFEFKSPSKSGILKLEASSSAFTHTILSANTANRIWTLPDTTDTFVGLSSTQTLTNKTLSAANISGATNISGTETNSATSTYSATQTFNGTVNMTSAVNITGNLSGRGVVPIGAVVPVFSIAGGFSIPASGVVSNGWMRADGAAVPAAQVVTAGTLTPNLSDSRFIMGATTSGTTGGANSITPAGSVTSSFSGTAVARNTWFSGSTYTPSGTLNLSLNNSLTTYSVDHSHSVTNHTHNMAHTHMWSYNLNDDQYTSSNSADFDSIINSGDFRWTENGPNATDAFVENALRQTITDYWTSGVYATPGGSSGASALTGGSTASTNTTTTLDLNLSHSHSFSTASFSGSGVNPSTTFSAAGNYTPSGSVSSSFSGSLFDSRPLYVSAIYLIRVS